MIRDDTIRVAVADDQALIRDGLRTQLRLAPDVILVGEASTGEQAYLLARRERPHVVLMDIRMPGTDGIEATRRIVADPLTAGSRVLILTTFDVDDYVYAALRAGASGFLLKDATPEELLHGIRVVAAGESLLAPTVTSRLIQEVARRPGPSPAAHATTLAALTEREREVLLLVAEGLSNTEIAERLVVSPTTAKTHVNRILAKLGYHDRVQLVVLAYESGLVVPGG
jgi:DNA-binding NarL/FixJ family response regulator